MTKTQLETILARHGLKVEQIREGAGKFRDLAIGTGAPYVVLNAVCEELLAAGLKVIRCAVAHISNHGHPQYGKPYLTIESFWYADECTQSPDPDGCTQSPDKPGEIYYCNDVKCPIHGERNRKNPVFQGTDEYKNVCTCDNCENIRKIS